MFFVLSKTLAFLFLPTNFLFLVLIAGAVLLFTRWRRAGVTLAATAVTLLALIVVTGIGSYALNALETRFPPWRETRGAPAGIIVLGGGLNSAYTRLYGIPVTGGDGDRLIAIGRLARAYPDARIIYTSGDGSLFPTGLDSEAQYVPLMLDDLGVPRGRVILETRSRNTAENAAFTKAIVQPKPGERWLLVTSAFHMPRSVGAFRKAGFDVEAYPVAWRTPPRLRWSFPDALSGRLATADLAAHEWMGVIVYYLTGRTSALLPGPQP